MCIIANTIEIVDIGLHYTNKNLYCQISLRHYRAEEKDCQSNFGTAYAVLVRKTTQWDRGTPCPLSHTN